MRLLLISLLLVSACGNKRNLSTIKSSEKPAAKDEAKSNTGDSNVTSEPVPEEDGYGSYESTEQMDRELNTIYFEHDATALTKEARDLLNENAEWMRSDTTRTIRIEGHTDESGTSEYNLGLGERRALSAKEYMVRLGIDAGRIEVITYGEEKPAGTDQDKNRRSVFLATK